MQKTKPQKLKNRPANQMARRWHITSSQHTSCLQSITQIRHNQQEEQQNIETAHMNWEQEKAPTMRQKVQEGLHERNEGKELQLM
jgi:hypothetical protein